MTDGLTWLDQVKAVYGEPRLEAANHPMREDEWNSSRRFTRDAWTWFVGSKLTNHSVLIDHFVWPSESWEVQISSHAKGKPYIEATVDYRPDDQLMADLLRVARFLDDEPHD